MHFIGGDGEFVDFKSKHFIAVKSKTFGRNNERASTMHYGNYQGVALYAM